MKVILKKAIKNLGLVGEIRQVKEGYARNYLIPQGLVEPASAGAIKNWELGKERRKKRMEKELKSAKEAAKKMSKTTLSYARKVSDKENIYGSVSKTDIMRSLKSLGFEVSKEDIGLSEPIKKIGETKIAVTLKPGATGEVKIKIVAKK
jgi:large subunit ribosomal protein L9